jgi:hypothetical protein
MSTFDEIFGMSILEEPEGDSLPDSEDYLENLLALLDTNNKNLDPSQESTEILPQPPKSKKIRYKSEHLDLQ